MAFVSREAFYLSKFAQHIAELQSGCFFEIQTHPGQTVF